MPLFVGPLTDAPGEIGAVNLQDILQRGEEVSVAKVEEKVQEYLLHHKLSPSILSAGGIQTPRGSTARSSTVRGALTAIGAHQGQFIQGSEAAALKRVMRSMKKMLKEIREDEKRKLQVTSSEKSEASLRQKIFKRVASSMSKIKTAFSFQVTFKNRCVGLIEKPSGSLLGIPLEKRRSEQHDSAQVADSARA